MEKETNKLEELKNESVKKMCELALEAFDNLPEETRKIEFSKLTIASLLIKQVIESVKELPEEEFTEICKSNEFVANTFKRISLFNTLGVDLGYARRIDTDDK